MAKMRKRFYVAKINGGGYEILSLKFRPSESLYSYSHCAMSQAFSTWDDATLALELATKGYALYFIDHLIKAVANYQRVTDCPRAQAIAQVCSMLSK